MMVIKYKSKRFYLTITILLGTILKSVESLPFWDLALTYDIESVIDFLSALTGKQIDSITVIDGNIELT